jgi:hypothetical protein
LTIPTWSGVGLVDAGQRRDFLLGDRHTHLLHERSIGVVDEHRRQLGLLLHRFIERAPRDDPRGN